jgi:single-stranded-DNA-specific exonuclease
MLAATPARPGLQIDGYLALAGLDLELVRDLERLAPFGPGNPALVLVSGGMQVTGARPVGRNDEHLSVELVDEEGATRQAIWWGGAGEDLPEGPFDLAYSARSNDYRGVPGVQVEWLAARPPASAPVQVRASVGAQPVTVDYRHEPDPHAILDSLRANEDVLLWCEGPERAALRGRTRLELAPARALAIWTAPPGRAELLAALDRVRPATVYLFGLDPGLDTPDAFLRRLSGLVKYALNATGGRVSLPVLTAAAAHRTTTVRLGLAWLQARGVLASLEETGDELRLGVGTSPAEGSLAQTPRSPGSGTTSTAIDNTAYLDALLAETAAYRAYFRQAGKDSLF